MMMGKLDLPTESPFLLAQFCTQYNTRIYPAARDGNTKLGLSGVEGLPSITNPATTSRTPFDETNFPYLA